MIYRATGNIRAIQILLGHTKIENTVRYLGVDIEDALLLAERSEICRVMRSAGRLGRPHSVLEKRRATGDCWMDSGRADYASAATRSSSNFVASSDMRNGFTSRGILASTPAMSA